MIKAILISEEDYEKIIYCLETAHRHIGNRMSGDDKRIVTKNVLTAITTLTNSGLEETNDD